MEGKDERKKRNQEHGTFKVQMPKSHSVCAKVQTERDIWAIEERHWRNTTEIK